MLKRGPKPQVLKVHPSLVLDWSEPDRLTQSPLYFKSTKCRISMCLLHLLNCSCSRFSYDRNRHFQWTVWHCMFSATSQSLSSFLGGGCGPKMLVALVDGNAKQFTFSFDNFLEIWLKPALNLDGNLTSFFSDKTTGKHRSLMTLTSLFVHLGS